MYDEYGEVIMEDDGYYYSPHGPEVMPFFDCDVFFQIQLQWQECPSMGCKSPVYY